MLLVIGMTWLIATPILDESVFVGIGDQGSQFSCLSDEPMESPSTIGVSSKIGRTCWVLRRWTNGPVFLVIGDQGNYERGLVMARWNCLRVIRRSGYLLKAILMSRPIWSRISGVIYWFIKRSEQCICGLFDGRWSRD